MARKQKPSITFASAVWDESDSSIRNDDYVDYNWSQDTLDLWEVPFQDLKSFMYMNVYDPRKLWSTNHSPEKIEKVILEWNANKAMSPIVLCHDGYDKLTIISGNHRFSVFVAFVNQMGLNPTIPFLIGSSEKSWIQQNIKSAIYKRTIK